MSEYDVDVAILGAGTAGMAAYREAARQTDRIALIDGGPLGTTCARVGCMPSKLLIAAADAAHEARHTAKFGVHTGEVSVDGVAVMHRLRTERDRFVGFVKEAVDEFKDHHLIRQNARFVDDNTLELADGTRLTARTVIIATGSRPAVPPPFEVAGDRLIINDDVFDWQDLPRSVAVFGAGVIGLELGQALSRLGVRVHLFGMGNAVGPLSDPDLIAYARDTFGAEFAAHFDADTKITRDGDAVVVQWSNRNDDSDTGEERFDFLLAATGRRPNLDRIGLENTSLVLDALGTPDIDPQSMQARTKGDTVLPIFVTGDAAVDLPLLHKAADEGRVAGENAARYPEVYRRVRRTGLGVVFSDPQIAIAGCGHKALTEAGVDFAYGEVSFEDQGRARVIGKDKGLLRVYGDRETGLLLGAEIIGPAAEHLGHLLAWTIESKLTVAEVLQRPFYHPVIEEGLRTALRNLAATLDFGPNPPLRCIDCGPGG
ncbi:dihydrolipoyl dehydrogenase [Roseobacter sp. OBYS 0001]|uniref:dihydrolipoyl dehydrogenase n=1 Tax=Roseobacter sp. OBYS 0001 TaxID=882651 RepID=UPI001BC5BD7A|nr:dihydrolipoyl dehydrogenase [Roseobacter sp. OBYS 0001]GIT88739.1 dihydrolipoyl dehydrogenase [Roseobacter sp. OBYS 0001]